MSEWRGIESAPKDGTIVLVWEPTRNDFLRARSYGTGWTHEHGHVSLYKVGKDAERRAPEGYMVPSYAVIEPTHWMPLPPPPDL